VQQRSDQTLKVDGLMSDMPPTLRRELQTNSGEKVYIFVQWPKPSRKVKGDFFCRYGVETSERTIKSKTYGTDRLQALYLALRGLHSMIDLVNSKRSDDDKIFWHGGMSIDDLGLPRWDSD
jgi:uncharacterized protein DUF6968